MKKEITISIKDLENLKFKKINAIIPLELYERLQQLKMFDENWDIFITRAIIKALADINYPKANRDETDK